MKSHPEGIEPRRPIPRVIIVTMWTMLAWVITGVVAMSLSLIDTRTFLRAGRFTKPRLIEREWTHADIPPGIITLALIALILALTLWFVAGVVEQTLGSLPAWVRNWVADLLGTGMALTIIGALVGHFMPMAVLSVPLFAGASLAALMVARITVVLRRRRRS